MRNRKGLGVVFTAIAVVVLLASCTTTPDWSMVPTYGSVHLDGGFLPDPYLVDVVAGGGVDLSSLGFVGFVAQAPDVDLYYSPTSYQLWIYVADATDDTVLLINDPSGNWHYSDDAENLGMNPGIMFPHPEAGLYDIWIGSYGGGYHDAVLAISEGSWSGSLGPDWQLSPSFGSAELVGNFSPDPYRVQVTTGTQVDLTNLGYFGYCAEAPDFDVYYTPQKSSSLYIYVEQASGDAVLLVNGPSGTWYFNDDSNGLNPGLVFSDPADGLYDIWVGSLDEEVLTATLVISRSGP